MTVRTIIKLLVLSLFVGLVMSFFGYGPGDVWQGVRDLGKKGFDTALVFFDWALLYIIIGAAVVIPVYILRRIFKKRAK